MMSPSRFHEPPTATPGQIAQGLRQTARHIQLLEFAAGIERDERPSGDQNGGGVIGSAVSEPGRGRTSSESMVRIQSRAIPSEPRPTNAR